MIIVITLRGNQLILWEFTGKYEFILRYPTFDSEHKLLSLPSKRNNWDITQMSAEFLCSDFIPVQCWIWHPSCRSSSLLCSAGRLNRRGTKWRWSVWDRLAWPVPSAFCCGWDCKTLTRSSWSHWLRQAVLANVIRTLWPKHKHIPGQISCLFIDCTRGNEHIAHADDVSESVGHNISHFPADLGRVCLRLTLIPLSN